MNVLMLSVKDADQHLRSVPDVVTGLVTESYVKKITPKVSDFRDPHTTPRAKENIP